MSELDPCSETVPIRLKYQGSSLRRRNVGVARYRFMFSCARGRVASIWWRSRQIYHSYGWQAPIAATILEERVHEERERLAIETRDAPTIQPSTNAPPPHIIPTSTFYVESSQPCASASESIGVRTSATGPAPCVAAHMMLGGMKHCSHLWLPLLESEPVT